MAVDTFDPASLTNRITPEVINSLVNAVSHVHESGFGLAPEVLAAMPGIAKHGPVDWAEAVKSLPDDEICSLITVFTLGERDLSGWEAGAKSPVIPMARELKRRGVFDAKLVTWIKSNSNNRFLPHGSLMDRL